ncbi:hypothetical protein MTBLM5_90103 [Magnetospirillum sp. LM-5]|uniref:radical SAM protein n=1 Tax=Magnetospirillum sp. LM-5 TaxID=2681466 RepID=UPI0013817ABD|nr:radical SAM protein [Magnetospirillum sp. LM-5]CAA7625966.1 hypothetical protein MTBLM5_90103 [Magnetospirillum sp. LM-5]
MEPLPSILAPISLAESPTLIDLEPVHNCNLRCRSCHVPQEELTKVALPIEAIAKLGVRDGAHCKVGTTHEPTTHPEFPTLLNVLGELGYQVSLTTNGTLLTDRMLDGIADYSVFKSVNLSFDAATPDLYEYLRVGAKFQPTLERIKAFIARLDRSRTAIHANYTMLRANLCDINAAVDMWDDIGVDGLVLMVSSDRQNNTFLHDQMLASDPESFYQATESAAQHLIDSQRRIQLSGSLMMTPRFAERFGHLYHNRIMYSALPDPLPPVTPPDPHPGRCAAPMTEVRIRWNGHVYLCNNHFLVGNLLEQTLEEIWTGPRAKFTRDLVAANGDHCLHCNYFHYCLSSRTDLDLSAAQTTMLKEQT